MGQKENTLVQISLLFYEEGLTQTEIAKKLNISRPTVAARLQEARDKGIVKISIQHEKADIIKQQNKIAKKYNLKTVLITSSDNQSSEKTKSQIGALCSWFMEDHIKNINSLGIGWGTTIYEFVQAVNYQNKSDLSIVPLIGGVGNTDVQYHSNHLAFILAQKYNCKVNYFYAPAIAESIQMKNSFEQSEIVKETINKGKNVDIAILGVGNPIESSTYSQLGYINKDEAQEIMKNKVVGDIAANFFDENGESVNTLVSERMIGLSLDDISKIKELVILASGKEKANSIKALLNKNIIDHLIIDSDIANDL